MVVVLLVQGCFDLSLFSCCFTAMGFVGVGLFVLFLLLVDYCGYLWAAGFSW